MICGQGYSNFLQLSTLAPRPACVMGTWMGRFKRLSTLAMQKLQLEVTDVDDSCPRMLHIL